MNSQDFVPIVIGSDTLGYSYAREFNHIYGTKTTMLSTADIKFSSKSRFVDYHIVDDIDHEDVLMGWLRQHKSSFHGKTPLVIGGASDWTVRNLSSNKPELESMGYVVPYIDFDLLDNVTQKDRFYAMCDKLSIPYPDTIVIPFGDEYDASVLSGTSMSLGDGDIHDIASDLDYPVIVKPSNSADWHYADIPGKHKVYKVANKSEFVSICESVAESSYSHALLVQEMLSDSDYCLHTVTTFSENGTMSIGVTGDVLIQDRSATGIGNPLVILGHDRNNCLLDYAKELNAAMGYDGYANFDVMDDKDGNPHFLEVNTRPGRNSYYVSQAGCPFVDPIVAHYVLGEELVDALPSDELAADRQFLFSMVPRSVIAAEAPSYKRNIALTMFDAGFAANPLLCEDDVFAQRFWANVNYAHMRCKF